MDLKLTLAISIGKLTALVLKVKGSGATAAPGLYALKIDPNLVKKLSSSNNIKSIVVSGTNGKTTTSRLIYDIFKTKYKIIHNRAGSNLLRGVASTLVKESSPFGKIKTDFCLWEADEAALLPISQQIKISSLVLLNLFRDQLDRYGEIDTTRKKWQQVVTSLPSSSTLIVNADDPSTNYLSKFTKAKKLFFGLETTKINLPNVENVADVKYCLNCGNKLTYKALYSAHLGDYFCPNCGEKRNDTQVKVTAVNFAQDFSLSLTLRANSKKVTINSHLPGLYSAYNIAAAAAAANSEFEIGKIKNSIENFSSAFGRFQTIEKEGKKIITLLIKNPAGANEVLRTIATSTNLNLLCILNDKIADGADVSWIWDTNWEILKSKVNSLTCSGTRAYDIALRLKYGQITLDKQMVIPKIKTSLSTALGKINKGETLIILPTYTAMLDLQQILSTGGEKWHQE